MGRRDRCLSGETFPKSTEMVVEGQIGAPPGWANCTGAAASGANMKVGNMEVDQMAGLP